MKICFLLVTLLSCYNSFSQESSKPEKTSVAGRFYGRVLDASTNKGLEATSVQLIQRKFDKSSQTTKDIPVNGMLTLKNGDFNFENVPVSSGLVLVITALGFSKHEQHIITDQKVSKKQGLDVDLGNIRLKIDPKLLQTVTVTAEKPLMSLGIDRKVFNVEKSLVSAGGTAEDVMRSVPSLSVDIDGNVSLRNSSPQIFVDGRPTTMALDQIPADAIQSVEIITNPSAKFDASGGGGGILNIVLKKNRKAGYNGSLKTGIDQRGRYSFGGDINVRQDKINMFASVNYRQRKLISKGTTDRLTFFDNGNTQLYQSDYNIQERANFFVRAGLDWLLDNRNTITVSGYFSDSHSNGHSTTSLLIDTMQVNGKNTSFSERQAFPGNINKDNGASIGYKHLFTKAGKEWTADLNFTGSNYTQRNNITTTAYNLVNGPVSNQFGQLIDGSGANANVTFQTDYIDPVSKNSKLELGARIQMKNADNRNVISYRNEMGGFAKIPQLSSDYINKNKVFAGYANFSNKINKFGYQVGLRLESSAYNGDVTTASVSGGDTLISYRNDFPFSLFPSMFLSQDLGKDQQLQFSITRRINRPDFGQLFPFTDYSDSLNLSRGNADLKPEFTYSAELAYEKSFSGKNIFMASLYYKYTDQLITRYQERYQNPVTGKEDIINTFINANSSYTGGLELIYRQSITKWWELTSNLNFFTTRIDLNNSTSINLKSIYSWFSKLNNTVKLPGNFSFEVSSEYSSKRLLPQGGGKNGPGKGGATSWGQPQATAQGFIRPRLEVDAAVRYDFLKNKKASVILHVSDIFRSDANNIYSESAYFRQNSYRLRDPQYFRIHFSWRFGKFDTSLFKRKNNKMEPEDVDEF